MKQINLALIYGGRSDEREVSALSAAAIFNHLSYTKYNIIPIGVAKDGKWYWQQLEIGREYESLPVEEEPSKQISLAPGSGFILGALTGRMRQRLYIDVGFPIIHGFEGEDGKLQGLLEMMNIPYVGSDVFSSALAMDKSVTKDHWKREGFPQAKYTTFSKRECLEKGETLRREVEGEYSYPLFVKPSNGGSSLGISKVSKPEEFSSAIEIALKYDNKILIEETIDGREIECAVIGNESVEVFGPGEISFEKEPFYDYHAKYEMADQTKLLIPAPLSQELREEVRALAERAYLCVGATGYARVDLFLTKDNRLYLNEINTIPGFTTMSMFPLLVKEGGIEFSEMLNRLIGLCLPPKGDL